MSKFIRVDMTTLKVNVGAVPEEYARLGGRALTSNFVNDEVKPTCHALGKNNKIIFAPGLLSGTSAPNSGRISVGAKSPLTGTIKESNSGALSKPKRAGAISGSLRFAGFLSSYFIWCKLILQVDTRDLRSINDMAATRLLWVWVKHARHAVAVC